MNETPVKCPLKCKMSNVPFTYESKINNCQSTIDNFFVSDNLLNSVNQYRTLIDVDNFSDHYPLQMQIIIPTNINSCNVINDQ